MTKTVVAFGEIMLRLTPPDKQKIREADCFSAFYGGSESNVLVALAQLGHHAKFVSALPDNDLGKGALCHLKRYGVDTSAVRVGGDNMGMYFLEEGFGDRQTRVIYARANAAITRLTETDFDYDAIFQNADIFHISGISFALSPSVQALCFRLLSEAKKRNIKVSFDFNYRAKLWDTETAKAVYQKIMPYADIVFCASRDLTAFLDVTPQTYFEKYSGAETLIVREREITSHTTHKIRAAAYQKGGVCAVLPEREFAVLERIGGGDAFDAGVLHGLLENPTDFTRALEFGAASFILKHTVRGDVLAAAAAEIEALSQNTVKDVKR